MNPSDHINSIDNNASPKPRRTKRGLALLSVLWVLALLALIAASFTRTTRTEINLTRNLIGQAKAEALADAGIHWAAAKLSEPAATGGWTIDGKIQSLPLEDGEVRVLISDEGGKIDLNAASRELLEALFLSLNQNIDQSAALADAIVDFRDTDDLRQLNGAEDDDYVNAGLTYGAKDAPFEDVTELQQVLGMTAQLYRLVAPSLTVYSRQRRPNPTTAPPLVAAALEGKTLDDSGDDESLQVENGDEIDSDNAGAPTISGLRSRISLYAIHSEGRTASGAMFARDAVLRLTGDPNNPFQILEWHQGERELFIEETSEEN